MELFPADWQKLLAPETPLFELLARSAILYFAILFLMRIMPRRSAGELATMDLIFALLIADSAAQSLGAYTSVSDGIILIVSLMAWNYLVNSLSHKVKFIERLVSAPPLEIVRNGRMLKRNMRRELLTEEELLSYLRQEGIDDVTQVKVAYVESEGQISVVKG